MMYLNEEICVSTDWKTSLPFKGGIYCSPDRHCVIVLFPTCNLQRVDWLVISKVIIATWWQNGAFCEHFWTDNVLRSMKWYESAKCLFETSWPCSYNSHSLWNWYIPLLSMVYLSVAGCWDHLSSSKPYEMFHISLLIICLVSEVIFSYQSVSVQVASCSEVSRMVQRWIHYRQREAKFVPLERVVVHWVIFVEWLSLEMVFVG